MRERRRDTDARRVARFVGHGIATVLVLSLAQCASETLDARSASTRTQRDGGSDVSAAGRGGADAGLARDASTDAGSAGRPSTSDASHRDARVAFDAHETGSAGGPGDADATDGSRDVSTDSSSGSACAPDCTPIGNTALPPDPCAAYAAGLCGWFGRCTSERPYDRACLPSGSPCAPSSAPCEVSLREQCEARLALADQGLTANDYAECARGMVDAPCGCTSEAIPACARLDTTPGKRADDDACEKDEQCASRACRQGACASRVPINGACDQNTLCALGTSCVLCSPPETCSHKCVPNLPCGASCDSTTSHCKEPFACTQFDLYPRICQLPIPPDHGCGFGTPGTCTAHFGCAGECSPADPRSCFYSCRANEGPYGPCTVDCTPTSTTVLPQDPCDAFAEAHCSWFTRCPHGQYGAAMPYGPNCRAEFRAICETSFGLPGQTATAADVVACAQAVVDAPCGCSSENIPQCLALRTAVGTLADGEACQADSQCQSAWCSAGTCAARTAAGSACDATRPCEQGHTCDGTCVPKGSCNAGCKTNAECEEPLTCIGGSCRPRLTMGSTCYDSKSWNFSDDCPGYAYCNVLMVMFGYNVGSCSPGPAPPPATP